MAIAIAQIKELREKTGAGIMECRKALEESGGDIQRAAGLLQERGAAVAAAKGSRKAEEGVVMAYVHHGGKLGSLIELNCETDFVARNEEFISLAKELSMQVAATSPKYVARDDIPADFMKAKEAEMEQQAGAEGQNPPPVKEKIDQLVSQICLLEQPYIRDAAVTIGSLITEKVAKFRERIRVKRFVVFKLGEDEAPTA